MLIINEKIEKKIIRIIINLENRELHININFIKKLRLQIKNKQRKYEINIASGLYLIIISRKITSIYLKIGKYLK